MSEPPKAFYSEEHRCWFVPVAPELKDKAELEEGMIAEPCRVELRDGELWITQLEAGESG